MGENSKDNEEPTCSSARREADRWTSFLNSTAGRDKVYRFAQYFSRLLSYHLSTTSKMSADRLARLSAALSLSRKLFRLGRPLDFALTMVDVMEKERDQIVLMGSVIKSSGYGLWLILDMIQYFHAIGVIKVAKKTLMVINKQAPRLWMLGIAASLMVSLYKLELKRRKGKVSLWDPLVYKAIQDVIDLLIPLSITGWLPLSSGSVGLAGTITSLMGAWSIYPVL